MTRYASRAADGKVVTRQIAGETILVPVAGSVGDLDAVYTLNEVGSFIWQRLDGRTVQSIAEEVARSFDVGLEQAARDLDELLAALASKGLVRLSDEPGEAG